MARNDPQVNLRIPADLKEEVDKAALANNRSMNAEVVSRLGASFLAPDDSYKVTQLKELIGQSQIEVWDARLEAGAIARCVLMLLAMDEVPGAGGMSAIRPQLVESLKQRARVALTKAHAAGALVRPAFRELAATAEMPAQTANAFEQVTTKWGDAAEDPVLNGKFEAALRQHSAE